MSLIASYGQTESRTDTAIVGLHLEGAKFFIDQNSEVNYLREENRNLKAVDSLSKIETSGMKEIIDSCSSIVGIYKEMNENKAEVLDEVLTMNSELSKKNNNLEESNRRKDKTIFFSLAALVVETVIIFIGR